MGKLVKLKIAPGFFRPATRDQAAGRYYDGTLVRWIEDILQPVGGWTVLQKAGPADTQLDGPGRGIHTWRSNTGSPQLAVGTTSKLWHYAGTVLTDITPSGFVSGLASGSTGTGLYGSGPYGAGLYGSGDPNVSIALDAQSWQFDNFGEDLVAVAYSDKRLFYWDRSVGGAAAPITNAPACLAVVVTEEGFVMALGASALGGGDIDAQQIRWTDETNYTTWTPDVGVNQAGDHKLRCKGQILAGRRGGSQQVYIWTDYEFFVGQFVGGTYIYRFDKRGEGCGAVSRRAMAEVDGVAYWMGRRSFFRFDGYVQPLPSEVSDYVFGDINTAQLSKVHAGVNSQAGEVTWFYCSAGSAEIDRYVTHNYRDGLWYFGKLQRTAWADNGVFSTPLAVDASGLVYQHETGTSYLDTDGVTALVPYADSGPISTGDGRRMRLQTLVPDEKTLGGVQLSLISSESPTGSETTHGPYIVTQPTPVRVEARAVRVRLTQVSAGWRFGDLQMELVAAGSRR